MRDSGDGNPSPNTLLEQLRLQPGDASRAYGEIQGNPVTLTVLGHNPLALLLGFKIVAAHPESMELPTDVDSLVGEARAEVSLEDGIAWLTLRDLSGETSGSIVALVESFAEALVVANLRLPPGCVLCGCLDDVEVLFSEGRCSRLCAPCAQAIVNARDQALQAATRPTVAHSFGLPLAFLFVSGGWLVLWFLLDLTLDWMLKGHEGDEIVLPDLLIGMIIAALGGVGMALGYPLGIFLRRSGVAFHSPRVATALAVLPACLAGEFLYIAVGLFWQIGVFDLLLVVQLFLPFVMTYPASWVIGKLVVVGAVALGCYLGARPLAKGALRL